MKGTSQQAIKNQFSLGIQSSSVFPRFLCLFSTRVKGWTELSSGNRFDKETALKYYLYLFGLLNLFAIPIVPQLASFLFWTPRNVPYELMITAITIAQGFVMLLITRNPLKHKAFIDFLILANTMHAIVMGISFQNLFHFIGVAAVGSTGLLPLVFYPWGLKNFLLTQQD